MSNEVNGRNGVGRNVHAILIGGRASVKMRDAFRELGSQDVRGKHSDRREPLQLCSENGSREIGFTFQPSDLEQTHNARCSYTQSR